MAKFESLVSQQKFMNLQNYTFAIILNKKKLSFCSILPSPPADSVGVETHFMAGAMLLSNSDAAFFMSFNGSSPPSSS